MSIRLFCSIYEAADKFPLKKDSDFEWIKSLRCILELLSRF